MEIRFLTSVPMPVLHRAFLRAFSDYFVPMQLSLPSFEELVRRRGVDFSISPGAFIDDELIAFHFNALDFYDGILTAYDSGTGTVPEFRKRGIAKALFEFCLPELKKRGAQQYLLEVFQQNVAAVRLYEKTGFKIFRDFESFTRPRDREPVRGSSQFQVRPIAPDWQVMQNFWDWNPSWQNSNASIQRSKSARVTLGAFDEAKIIGYGIVFIDSGDIAQFCVDRSYRRKGVGSSIFRELQIYAPQASLRTINIDNGDKASLKFVRSQNFRKLITQYEMRMALT